MQLAYAPLRDAPPGGSHLSHGSHGHGRAFEVAPNSQRTFALATIHRGALVPLYRLYHSGRVDHLYTTSQAEVERMEQQGYRFEGIACLVLPAGHAAGVPLYRLYDPVRHDHFYTTSLEERLRAESRRGYVFEGVECHALPRGTEGTVPFYAVVDDESGNHFYTVSPTERDRALSRGAVSGEIVCGAFPFQAPLEHRGEARLMSERDSQGDTVRRPFQEGSSQ